MEKSDHMLSDIVEKYEKKPNKERAKEHRERKKQYINSLEEQVVLLKTQVAKLEEENKKLKWKNKLEPSSSIGMSIDNLLKRLDYEAQYAQLILPNMIKNNLDQVRFSMIEQTNETMGSFGSYRIQLIKNWIKLIIDNIVYDRMKAIIAWAIHMPSSNFLNIFKPTKEGKNKPKRFKVSEDNEIMRIAGDLKFSDGMFEEWMKGSKIFKKEIGKLNEMIHDLVKLRNKILNQLKFIQDYWNKSEEVSKYTKNDFISINSFANRLKNTKYTNIFYLWNIPKRSESSATYKDNEMTDDEEENSSFIESSTMNLS